MQGKDDDWEINSYNGRTTGNTYNTTYNTENMLKIMLAVLNDDPRIKIIMLLAESPASDIYISFRTIARRIGINYSKLKHYLSQLEAAGLVESIKIRSASPKANNNNGNRIDNNKGYTYYKLRQEFRETVRKVLSRGKITIYYLHFISLAATLICFYIM